MMKTIAASTLLLFVVAPVVASTKLSVRRHLEVASNEVCFSNLSLGTDAGDVCEVTPDGALAPQLPVVPHREPVRLE